MPVNHGKAKVKRTIADPCKTIEGINLLDVIPNMVHRSIPRKDFAKLTRELFKTLGIKGMSVTCPNYSMATSIHIEYPQPRDVDMGINYDRDREINRKLRRIMDKAFPNMVDRSDSMTDHFDSKYYVRGVLK